MGPTAAGKTDLAVSLVEQGPCEIISVDSALVYQGMDIGTAKPDAETLARAPHRLIDMVDPADSYSAVQFRRDALQAIQEVHAAGKVPLLAGGTMLYYKALLEPMADLPPGDEQVRAELQQQLAEEGLASLVAELAKVDPVAFERIDQQNPQRVQRALEVFRITGRPISSYWAEGAHDGKGQTTDTALEAFPYALLQYCVMPSDRNVLHERIALRYRLMLEQGFEQEVAKLMARGDLHLDLPSMRCVGYRQMWEYLAGEYDHATMIEKGVAATRQLAKRQLTWLRKWPGLEILDTTATNSADYTQRVLKDLQALG